jgi:hypothetical protein
MAEYTLTNSAAVVDASIQKVANADTTPTDGSPLMVTSGGVKSYVDTADTALETQILANTAAIAGSGVKTAKLTVTNGSSSSDYTFPFSVSVDPDSLVSVSNNTVSLPNAGTYLVGFSGSFSSSSNYAPTNYFALLFYRKTSVIYQQKIAIGDDGVSFNYVTVETDGTASFKLIADEVGAYASLSWDNLSMHVIKLA